MVISIKPHAPALRSCGCASSCHKHRYLQTLAHLEAHQRKHIEQVEQSLYIHELNRHAACIDME